MSNLDKVFERNRVTKLGIDAMITNYLRLEKELYTAQADAERYRDQLSALGKSMKQTIEDAGNRVEGFKDLTPLQQDFVRQMAVANVTAHLGGLNKKENT